jgi:hypothetical protein
MVTMMRIVEIEGAPYHFNYRIEAARVVPVSLMRDGTDYLNTLHLSNEFKAAVAYIEIDESNDSMNRDKEINQ